MKNYIQLHHLIWVSSFAILLLTGCMGNTNKEDQSSQEVISAEPDTGYTGIKQFMAGSLLSKEVSYKNGVQDGLTKTFYASGKVRQTFWYENNLKQDSSRWYYTEGQLFRTTPYKDDTVQGIQKQYYRNGKIKALIGYDKGLRTPYLEEYKTDGKLLTNYPDIVVNTTDNYNANGTYRITLSLSDNSTKVTFYHGSFTEGRFDTAHIKELKSTEGKATIVMKKADSPTTSSTGVIASILTSYGNRKLVYKEIDLPYNDLK